MTPPPKAPPPCNNNKAAPLKTLNVSPGSLLQLRGYLHAGRAASGKRRSAVELLQESKAFYVKSEHVLDAKQELKNSGHLHVASPAVDLFLRTPAPAPVNSHQRTKSLDKTAFTPVVALGPALAPRQSQHSPPPLPPKSPRVSAARARAAPNSAAAAPAAPRRCRRQQHADDVQMKLRKLLSSGSTEKSKGWRGAPRAGPRTGPRYRRLLDDEDGEEEEAGDDEDAACLELELSLGELEKNLKDQDSPPFGSKTVSGEKVYLRSRHSTPTAHSSRSLLSPAATAKSLPDLSPLGHHADSSTTTPGSEDDEEEEEETSGASSGRHRYYPSSRATSDYVSRSPSSCKCCGGRRRAASEAGSAPARAHQLQDQEDEDDLSDQDSGDGACRTSAHSRRSSPARGGSPSPGVRRRPILRSKSDISHRYSRAAFLAPPLHAPTMDDCVDGGDGSPPGTLPRRSSADLAVFFEQLGLGEEAYQAMAARRPSRDLCSPVFFASVSSVDSWPGTWAGKGVRGGSGDSGPLPPGPGGSKLGEQPSIVERNARIIKWLCNCRKAHLGALS